MHRPAVLSRNTYCRIEVFGEGSCLPSTSSGSESPVAARPQIQWLSYGYMCICACAKLATVMKQLIGTNTDEI